MAVAAIAGDTSGRERSPIVPGLILGVGLVAATATGLRAEQPLQTILLTGMLFALAAIAAMDSVILRAPNRVVYPISVFSTGAAFVVGMQPGLEALFGGVLAFLVVLGVVVLGRGSMGYGDAKVAYICGAVVGASNVLLLVLLTFGIGGIFAAFALTVGGRKRKDAVAFTPFLLVGVILALTLGTHGVYDLTGGWR